MDDFTESQKNFMHNLFANLNSTINEKTSEIRSELQNHLSVIREEVATAINNFNHKVDKLEKDNQSLHKNILFLQRKVRKNNIIVFGIDRDTPVVNSVIRLFNDILEVPVKESELNDCYRLNNNNKEPPVIVEFISFQQKLTVLKNAKKLKGKNIAIAKDLCKEDRETNKELLIHQKEARNKGKSAFIRGDKLLIENDIYTIDQLRTEATEIEIQEKIGSAPTTPNPTIRQKRLLLELGLEEDKQEPKKIKAVPSSTKGLNDDLSKIQTRSNSTTRKK